MSYQPAVRLKQADAKRPAMGLEQVGLSVFEGATTTLSPAIVRGQVEHGLTSKEDIKLVEEYYGWKFSKSEDVPFWATVVLKVDHSTSSINLKNGEDVLKLGVLKAQGKLAPTIEEQSDPNKNYIFVLENEVAVEEQKVTLYQKRSLAHTKLAEIYEKAPKYLIALTQYLIDFQGGLASEKAAFAKLTEFIDGLLGQKKGQSVDLFMNAIDPSYGGKTPKENIFLMVDIKKAMTNNIIKYDGAQQFYYNPAAPGSNYGRTLEEIYNYLTAIQNADHLGTGSDKDAPYSIRYLLRNAAV